MRSIKPNIDILCLTFHISIIRSYGHDKWLKEANIFYKLSVYFLQIILSPVPDNIFLFDIISIISPSLTWSTLIIATPWLWCVLLLLWVAGNKCVKLPGAFPFTTMSPCPTCSILAYVKVNFSRMKQKKKTKKQQQKQNPSKTQWNCFSISLG